MNFYSVILSSINVSTHIGLVIPFHCYIVSHRMTISPFSWSSTDKYHLEKNSWTCFFVCMCKYFSEVVFLDTELLDHNRGALLNLTHITQLPFRKVASISSPTNTNEPTGFLKPIQTPHIAKDFFFFKPLLAWQGKIGITPFILVPFIMNEVEHFHVERHFLPTFLMGYRSSKIDF